MAPAIPTREPSEFTQGDTVKWIVSFGDFPADDGWTLAYAFRGPEKHDATATADGAAHAVVLSKTATLAFSPGIYYWDAYASKGTERFKARTGQFEVLIDKDTLDAAFDGRTFNAKMLEAIETLLLRKSLRGDQASYSIEGRALSRYNMEELEKWKEVYIRKVKAEDDALRVAQGLGSSNKIRSRFVRP